MGAGASATDADELVHQATLFVDDSTVARPQLKKSLLMFAKMRKAGVPLGACLQAASLKGLANRPNFSDEDIAAFRAWCLSHVEGITTADLLEDFVGGGGQNDGGGGGGENAAGNVDSDVSKYEQMLRMGVPRGAVKQKMQAEGQDPALLD